MGLPSGEAERPQQVLRHLVGGGGIVAVGLFVEELAEPDQRARSDGYAEICVSECEAPDPEATDDE